VIPFAYNVQSLKVRATTTAASVFGIGLVVFVFAAALMLVSGVHETLGNGGHPDVAIVMRNGSNSEMGSIVASEGLGIIEAAPGVKHDEHGKALAVGEVVVVATMKKLGGDGIANVQIRGVPDNVWEFRPEARIVRGRKATPGTNEVVIGHRIDGRFPGLDLDQSFPLKKNRPVKVVGVFDAGGSSYDSEIWADRGTLAGVFGRQGVLCSVRVRLETPAAFDAFRAAVEQDKRLGLGATREPAYFEAQSEKTAAFVGGLGVTLAVFLAFSAMIGAMITLYGSIASRQREIGVLKAMGFPASQVLASFVLEALVIAAIGGTLGVLAALAVGNVEFTLTNFESWSQMIVKFHTTPSILVTASVFTGGMGLLGGFLPALRAARLNTVAAIRGE
jgi:putative ABC transport system permease protein